MEYRTIKVSEEVYYRLTHLKYLEGGNSKRYSGIIEDLLDMFEEEYKESKHNDKSEK